MPSCALDKFPIPMFHKKWNLFQTTWTFAVYNACNMGIYHSHSRPHNTYCVPVSHYRFSYNSGDETHLNAVSIWISRGFNSDCSCHGALCPLYCFLALSSPGLRNRWDTHHSLTEWVGDTGYCCVPESNPGYTCYDWRLSWFTLLPQNMLHFSYSYL
jgi:hypothetical protein